MTTYVKSKLDKRKLGVGCETYAYTKWSNKSQVTLFTINKYKWHWLNFLGLTRSEQSRVYFEYPKYNGGIRREARWRFDVVKLRECDRKSPEWGIVVDEIHRFHWSMSKNDINQFTVLRPVIEFCALVDISEAILDSNWFNFLQHPRTKRIYPYDFFVPPRWMKVERL